MTAVVMLCTELGFAQTDWIKHPENPVLGFAFQVGHPSVILDNGIYHMWYTGSGGIGYATLEDGIHWTEYDNNPVLNLGPSET